MPAELSSPIPSGLDPLCDADPLQEAETPHLLAYLASVPDQRAPRGCRHPLIAILAVAAAAVLAGACSMTAIAEWAAEAPSQSVPRSAPAATPPATTASRPKPPSAGPWAAWTRRPWPQRSAPGFATATAPAEAAVAAGNRGRWQTLRGARRNGRQVHLLAAIDHATRAVPAQRQVDGAPEEVPAFAPLLAPLDLAGVVVTADALQTHPEAAEFLVCEQHAHYLLVVKANQTLLLARCQGLPWHRVPVLDRNRDRGHGRVEIRTLKAVSVHHFGFPHAAQVLQVTRTTRDL